MKKSTIILVVFLSILISPIAKAYDNLLFVTITSENCSACQKLRPVLEELEWEYGTEITFLTLDVSTRSSIEDAKQKAEDNGIVDFFNKNKNSVPKVGILCPGGKVEKVFLGETRLQIYKETLDRLLSSNVELCSL